MGTTLNEGDRLKLAKQLQQTLHSRTSRVIEAQKTHMDETTTHLQQSIEQDLRLTRLDAMQQIDTVLRLHTSDKQDTSLEQQQLAVGNAATECTHHAFSTANDDDQSITPLPPIPHLSCP